MCSYHSLCICVVYKISIYNVINTEFCAVTMVFTDDSGCAICIIAFQCSTLYVQQASTHTYFAQVRDKEPH